MIRPAAIGELPLPTELFGDDPTVTTLTEYHGEVMIGLVTSSSGRWGVVSVDETSEGAWIYLVVPLGPSVGADALTDPMSLRSLLTDPDRTVLSLVGTDTAGIQWGPVPVVPDGWLPA